MTRDAFYLCAQDLLVCRESLRRVVYRCGGPDLHSLEAHAWAELHQAWNRFRGLYLDQHPKHINPFSEEWGVL